MPSRGSKNSPEPPVQNDHVLLLTFVVVTTFALLRGFRKPPNMFVKGAKNPKKSKKIQKIVIVISFLNAKWAVLAEVSITTPLPAGGPVLKSLNFPVGRFVGANT